jgi:hypothetical protein
MVPCGLHEGSASPLLLLGSAAAALPFSCCMIEVLLAQSMHGVERRRSGFEERPFDLRMEVQAYRGVSCSPDVQTFTAGWFSMSCRRREEGVSDCGRLCAPPRHTRP